jgi:hypothetical protein
MSALVKSRHVQRTSRCPLGAKSGHSSVRCVVHTTVPFSYAESDNLTEHLNCSRSKRAEPESQCLLRYHVVVNQAAIASPSRGRSSRVLVIWSALIVTAVWSIATGAYFAFRGDDASYLRKRIADLRGEFDRVVSQQFLDQERIQHQLNVLLQQQATLEQHKSALPDDQLATGSISAKAPDSGIIASGPPVAELSSAIAASTPKSASVRHRHRPRAQRQTAARPQQQPAPAASQLDLGQGDFAPE